MVRNVPSRASSSTYGVPSHLKIRREEDEEEEGKQWDVVEINSSSNNNNNNTTTDAESEPALVRPRRPRADTLAYCMALPLGDDVEEETARVAAVAAVGELRTEVASLAGDERASAVLETLARRVCSGKHNPQSVGSGKGENKGDNINNDDDADGSLSLRRLVDGLRGYLWHLALHRYGSHVVQTFLGLVPARLGAETKKGDEESGESDQTPPLLHDMVVGMAEELSPHASDLAVHVCGSHVLRALICVLGGLAVERRPFQQDKKKKKKKRKRAGDDGNGEGGGGRGADDDDLVLLFAPRVQIPDPTVRKRFRDCLDGIACSLMKESKDGNGGDPTSLACHPSAGPALKVLLRVLCFVHEDDNEVTTILAPEDRDTAQRDFRLMGIHPSSRRRRREERGDSSTTLDQLIDFILGGGETDMGSVVYDLAGDPTGSVVLDAVLRTADDDTVRRVCEKAYSGQLRSYVEHGTSNYTLQTLLSVTATVASSSTSASLIEELLPLVEDGTLLRPDRRGVLWRLCELCCASSCSQLSSEGRSAFPRAAFLQSLRIGMAIEDPDERTKARSKKRMVSMDICVQRLLRMEDDEGSSGRRIVDVNGARTLHHMLKGTSESLSSPNGVVGAVIDGLSPNQLEAIARDGLASRCVWDALIAQFNAQAATRLVTRLKGRWAVLATDRVGHHGVMRLFQRLRVQGDDGFALAKELVSGAGDDSLRRLRSNAMGRAVVEALCLADLVRGGKYTWRDAMAAKFKSDAAVAASKVKSDAVGFNKVKSTTLDQDLSFLETKNKETSDGGDVDNGHPSKRRKRKRNKKSDRDRGEEDRGRTRGDHVDSPAKRKAHKDQGSSSSIVASIMDQF